MLPAPQGRRFAVAIVATAALVTLVAACSGSPSVTGSFTSPSGSTNATGSSNTAVTASSPLLAFSQCMRSQGVPNFPDPQPGTNNAKFPSAQQLGVSSSKYQATQTACQHLLPAGIDDQFPAAEVQELLIGMRAFSQCMRSHGEPNWPDPAVGPDGRPYFPLSSHGYTRAAAHSPQLAAKQTECGHLVPSALGGIPVG
jgi:hypothetical protein